MWVRISVILVVLGFFTTAQANGAQPVFTAPAVPWQNYREVREDPNIGPPYIAYHLAVPGKQSQEVIAYRLFASLPEDILGSLTQQVLKQYYEGAVFTVPRTVTLCGGMKGSSFSYTFDFNHDGHKTLTREVLAQRTAIYAIIYRRAVEQKDDAQGLRALQSFCPPKQEPLPTPPAFQIEPLFGQFSPPASFEMIFGQTENSLGWTDTTAAGITVVTVRHDPTLLKSTDQYGAEQRRLAGSHAYTLSGFRDYTLVENRAQGSCAGDTTSRWYTKIRGTYYGKSAIAEQIVYVQDRTLHSAGYLRPVNVPNDPRATAAIESLCPRQSSEPNGGGISPASGIVGATPALIINGISLTAEETASLYMLIFRSAGIKTQTVWKNRDEMPRYAPNYAYAGKDLGGQGVLWLRRGIDQERGRESDQQRTQEYRERHAAALAAALDDGQGGAMLQALVHRRTPEALTMLGYAFLDGIRRASDQTIANSLATADWISGQITPGMNRDSVATALAAKGIQSTSPVRKVSNCETDLVKRRWWDWNDPNSECAASDTARPVIRVVLDGQFEPGCSFSSFIDVLFDERDHVQRLALSNPIANCL